MMFDALFHISINFCAVKWRSVIRHDLIGDAMSIKHTVETICNNLDVVVLRMSPSGNLEQTSITPSKFSPVEYGLQNSM